MAGSADPHRVQTPLGTPLHGFSREQFLEAFRHGSGRSPRTPCDRAAGTSLARPEVRLTRLSPSRQAGSGREVGLRP